VNRWFELYGQHASLRDSFGLQRSLQAVLRKMSEAELVAHNASWFLRKREVRAYEFLFTQPTMGSTDAGVIKLLLLPTLKSAELSISAVLANNRLHEFVASISGTTLTHGDWVAAVHLHSDRDTPADPTWNADWAGDGACTHAVYHCHVGPTMKATPKVRVPLPAVSPADALLWLVATVYPDLEPAPWSHFPQRT
jgi:hypothetical protein